MRNSLKIGQVLLLAIVLLTTVVVHAEDDDTLTPEAIAKMKGKDLFRTFCKVCHGEDADAGEYTPMTLIQEQWEEFFDEDEGWNESHAELTCPADTTELVTETITDEMLEKIREFCVDHAADSEQPMTCG